MIQKAALILGVAFAAFGLACNSGDGWETGGPLEIVVSRTSGVAPLLVVFEGDLHPGQGSPAPFHEFDYLWDFGDSGSGEWSTTGETRNLEYGPIAAHVFEEPGTYTVRLAVRNGLGDLTTGEVQITVEDPDAVFAGANTICFSGSGSFDGCPGGAMQVTTSSMGQVNSHVAAGKRLLLHRGETFTGNGELSEAGPGIVGAYGSGDAPRIALSGSAGKGFRVSGGNPRTNDWRIMDLEIDGSGASSAMGVEAGSTVRDFLMLRLDIHDIDIAFEFSSSVLNFGNDDPHDVVGIVDSIATGFVGDLNGGFVSGVHFVVLGTAIDLNTNGEHTLRADMMRASVIGHSIFSNPASAKSCLKLHAPTWTGNEETDYTERVVIRRCTFIGADNDWLVTPGPQNSESNEHVRDVIVDGSYFVAGSGTQVGLTVMGESITARNNVFDMSAGLAKKCMDIADRGAGPSPRDVAVLHNTCFSGEGSAVMVDGGGNYPNVAVSNNLIVSPGDPSVGVSGDDDTLVEGNLTTSDGGFVSGDPSTVEDFRLGGGSAAENAGAVLPVLVRDLEGTLRPVGAGPDVGAYERN